MKVIRVDKPGPDYRLILTEGPRPQPGTGEVVIKVVAAGLNNADLLQARGLYPPPFGASSTLGLEVSGTIADVGPEAGHWERGEKVCALLSGGGYAEYAIAHAGAVLPVPDTIDLVEAAGLPEAAFTAWTNIMGAGRLAPGESMLIHGGTSGIGSLAIQVFASRGHSIFTTAGSDQKCEACRRFGAVRAINYRLEDFVAIIAHETQNRGVDVILDVVGGNYIQRNIRAAAPWGRIVNIAYQDGFKADINFKTVLTKSLTLAATTLRGRSSEQKRAIRNELALQVWPGLGTRILPVVQQVFPLIEAQSAHQKLAEHQHIGKILLKVA